MTDVSNPTHKQWVKTVVSSGTSGNLSVARRVVSWVRWLRAVQETHPEVAIIWSKAARFVFTNTDEDSLEEARRTVLEEIALSATDVFRVETRFDLNPTFNGEGCTSFEEGTAAATAYLPLLRKLAKNSHDLEVVCNVGSGHTGTASFLPFIKAAYDEGCWVTPSPIKSTASELSKDRAEKVDSIMAELGNLPMWATVADNGFLQNLDHPWNAAPTQQSYDRIDSALSHSFRTMMMMQAHPIQIDRSKLKGKIFSGYGGFLSVAATDIDISNPNWEEEIQRVTRLVVENPIAIEKYPDEKSPCEAIETVVTGVMGGVPGTFERMFLESIRNHKIVTQAKKPVELFHQRFAQYLSPKSASVFVLMTRRRKGASVDSLRLCPKDHPILVALREAEHRAMASISSEAFGRVSRESEFANIARNSDAVVSEESVEGSVKHIEVEMPSQTRVVEEVLEPESETASAQAEDTEPAPILVPTDQPPIAHKKSAMEKVRSWIPSFLKSKPEPIEPVSIPSMDLTREGQKVDSKVGAVKKGVLNIVSSVEQFMEKYPTVESMRQVFSMSPDVLTINAPQRVNFLDIIDLFPSQEGDDGLVMSPQWIYWFIQRLKEQGVKIYQETPVRGKMITLATPLADLKAMLAENLPSGEMAVIRDLYSVRRALPAEVYKQLAGVSFYRGHLQGVDIDSPIPKPQSNGNGTVAKNGSAEVASQSAAA